MKKHRLLFNLIVIALTGFVAACTNPYAADHAERGGLRLAGVQSGEIGAATVFPDVDKSEIESYEITLADGQNADEFEPETVDADGEGQIDPDGALEFEDLVPGEWTVDVKGFDDDDELLVSGSKEGVEVERGEYSETTVTVHLIDDPPEDETGDWKLDLEWDDQKDDEYKTSDVVTHYSVSFTPRDGQDDEKVEERVEPNGTKLSLSGDDFEPGAYDVEVSLISDDNERPYDGSVQLYQSIWHIYGNQTTAEELFFDESSFSFGGGTTIEVDVDTPEDLDEFFDTAPDTVPSGESVTIETVFEDEDVSWRINGQDVEDGDEDIEITGGKEDDKIGLLTDVSADSDLSFTPEKGWDGDDFSDELDFPAGINLNVMVIVETDKTYSAEHEITVEEADDD